MNERTIFIHVHIPKNGGTTFNRVLDRVYGRAFVKVYSHVPGEFFSSDKIADLVLSHPHMRCLASHSIRAPLPALEGVRFQPVTFLRDPVRRLVSLYYHERKITTRAGREHCSQLPFDEYFVERITHDNALENWQTFHIAGCVDLEKAKALLDEYFFVGLLERYDASLLLLSARIGWPRPFILYARQNRGPSRPPESIMSRETLNRLRELNAVDIALYQHYRQQHDAEVRSLGKAFARQLNLFRKINMLANRVNRVRRSLRFGK
ncbi:MAG: sulfotransferase family protein [Chloroflexi bacterium]|nr:sulfotransferase family protein [Chloroflexota bacterium]